MNVPPLDDEVAWSCWQDQWDLREDTIYLNHGSFGPPPRSVRAARQQWQRRLDRQPMDFFVRQLESAWLDARRKLAMMVGACAENLIFVENATVGMNLVANSFSLKPDDQVVLTNHVYGAVHRIWERACGRAGAETPVIARLPDVVESRQQVVDAVFAPVSEQTRLLVISHITSLTALILPIKAICHRASELGVAVCVDGPHAPVQVPLDIDAIGCDFYTASCHKWLCAPFGSGFLAVTKARQEQMEPATLSWGRLPPNDSEAWWEEFLWSGTRDPSAYLSIPAAIDFFNTVGLDAFRQRTHALARYARRRLVELTGRRPPLPDTSQWYGSMALVPLPLCDATALQQALWQRHGIEVPIIDFQQHQYIRVSCHLYNTPKQIDRLVDALHQLGVGPASDGGGQIPT